MAHSFTPHPGDEQMLLKIRRYLIGFRITNGWTQEELSRRISNTANAVWSLEKGGFDWTLARLQAWPKPFGLQLHAAPLFYSRLPTSSEMWCEIIDKDPMLQMAETTFRGAAEGRDHWQRLYLTTYLRVAREKQGITTAELGQKLGITASAVSSYENNANNVRLLRLLNHARALGGQIELEVS